MNISIWNADTTRSLQLLRTLLAGGRPTVVAGCVTDGSEQQRVIEALTVLRRCHPEQSVIERQRDVLRALALPHLCRSALTAQALPADTAVLALCTMGELRDFYATASVAHVGVDHNVLEPLDFGKPMTVSPGWDRTYPSFPVFEMLRQPDELMEADDAAALEAAWTHCLEQGPSRTALDARARQALAKARGATERHLQALAPLLAALHGQRPGRS